MSCNFYVWAMLHSWIIKEHVTDISRMQKAILSQSLVQKNVIISSHTVTF